MLLTIFCFLDIDKKIKVKVFACFFDITNLKMLSVILYRDTKAAILTLKMPTAESPSVIL